MKKLKKGKTSIFKLNNNRRKHSVTIISNSSFCTYSQNLLQIFEEKKEEKTHEERKGNYKLKSTF